MRLSVLFLGVLAASVILASLAAWGITYGSSLGRLTTMSSEFADLAHNVLQQFNAFMTGLLQSNSALVDNILALERQSGDSRMQQTKAQVMRIIGQLVNYTTNATAKSQQQMNDVVDTFAHLMDTVVTDFKGVATGYASDLRFEFATKISAALANVLTTRTLGLLRFQAMFELGVFNLSRAASDPVNAADCVLLAALCDFSLEFGDIWETLDLVTSAGRFYSCVPGEGAFLSVLSVAGSRYTEYHRTWLPSATVNVRQQCSSAPPIDVVVGQNCSLLQGCQCGADQRCSLWYTPHLLDAATGNARLLISDAYIGKYGTPQITLSYAVLNHSDASTPLLAVVSNDFTFAGVDYYLASLAVSNSTNMAVVLNDTTLTLMGNVGQKCSPNEIPPGNTSLPVWSALRTCDPDLLSVVQWLWQNRAAVRGHETVEISGIVWDIFPDARTTVAYYCIIGTREAELFQAIEASDTRATSQLSTVRAQQLGKVAAGGAATQAFMGAVQAENIQDVQAMQDTYLAQVQELETSSRLALSSSQLSSTIEVEQLLSNQTEAVDALKAKHLNALAVATAWIIAVVFAILFVVLLLSAWGTVRLTRSLVHIIGVMEEAADMRVEGLEVPQNSHITEVARIQAAFQVLVTRLSEYKGYMPAGLFEQAQEKEEEFMESVLKQDIEARSEVSSAGDASRQCSKATLKEVGAKRPVSIPSSDTSTIRLRPGRAGVPGSILSIARSARKNISAMCVNIVGFREVLSNMGDGVASGAYNQYVTLVHEVVSQGRGNIDCILGDQILVTFNAHIPCADPAGSSSAVSLELQNQLRRKLSDRFRFQIGLAFGAAVSGTVGYAKFKCMVTMGWPMKVAAMLSHIAQFDNGSVLADTALEERVKYSYMLRPVELVHLPRLTAADHTVALSSRVYLIQSKKQLEEDEWLYQLEKGAPTSDWDHVFSRMAAAMSREDQQAVLQQYLADHPGDTVALRLWRRRSMWVPGIGVPLCEGVEHTQ